MREAELAGADRFHVDVMDGIFVPNISLGVPVVRAMRPATTLPIEAHLMIDRPERYLEAFVEAGADTVLVHQENSPHLHRTLQRIKQLGARAGVVLNPSTQETTLSEVLEEIDLILVMTVNPGFGGQEFIPSTLPKISRLAEMLRRRNPSCELEVDGGIDPETTPRIVAAGATVLVAGTAIFQAEGGIAAAVAAIQKAAREAGLSEG
jgi:ribulose-phosphate 3-epimerase